MWSCLNRIFILQDALIFQNLEDTSKPNQGLPIHSVLSNLIRNLQPQLLERNNPPRPPQINFPVWMVRTKFILRGQLGTPMTPNPRESLSAALYVFDTLSRDFFVCGQDRGKGFARGDQVDIFCWEGFGRVEEDGGDDDASVVGYFTGYREGGVWG